ncbi:MAG TPA: class I tRNA ligase family protein, partial [Pyrinomonadaceae bacterium]|nr:class I tRNA ligase family protein [Pyrinomonadaceae bacterium]
WRWQGRLSRDPGAHTFRNEDLSPEARALRRKTHQTIHRITDDFEHLHLNTSVAALMELFNELSDFNADPATASAADAFVVQEALTSLILMLAPYCPHVAEEMWQALGHGRGLLSSGARWPVADPELAREEELEIPVQVNGKLRSRLFAPANVSEQDLRAAALADEKVRTFIDGRKVVKVIVVPQRLVNVVVR